MTALLSVAAAVAAAGCVLWWLRRTLVAVDVSGPSMAPTLADGDRVLVRRRRTADLRVGDVVVLEVPRGAGPWPADADPGHRWMVKRVAALPGDPTPAVCARAAGVAPGAPVPPGRMVVLGDNAALSADSRVWGYVPARRLLGVIRRRMARPRTPSA
ncbi:S26 family signal peptidase [Nocardiopsis changdeensis]|uniref:S26 family signal peptidase n=1 Tax=Nocardiopsis changdeensis TaxID=2831969 RepID=UPI003F4827B9